MFCRLLRGPVSNVGSDFAAALRYVDTCRLLLYLPACSPSSATPAPPCIWMYQMSEPLGWRRMRPASHPGAALPPNAPPHLWLKLVAEVATTSPYILHCFYLPGRPNG
jgi:hypothetical protein